MNRLRDELAWDLGTPTGDVPVAGVRSTNYPAADVVLERLRSWPPAELLAALGIPYREAWKCDRTNDAPICDYQRCTCLNPDPQPVLVVDKQDA